MSAAAITVEEVSKRYRIYLRRHSSIKEILVRRSLGNWRELWALRDVSFHVQPGEVLGVIGDNGSGKSTLLRVLAGILKPDGGTAQVSGRVSSMLELGEGFHPEYTGRENVYLYGAILGLRLKQIARHFEEIVSFSELAPFIDYPVKNYSSGMHMRLGFAIAVHLAPDVLLIDEVLAVGDAGYQRKCFDRMRSLRKQGKTIVLVSHDLESIRSFCDRVIWLSKGRLAAAGEPGQVIAAYLDSVAGTAETEQMSRSGGVRLTSVRLLGGDSLPTRSPRFGEDLTVEISYALHEQRPVEACARVDIFRNDGVHCVGMDSGEEKVVLNLQLAGGQVLVRFPGCRLNPGTYDLSVGLRDGRTGVFYDLHERRYPFTMLAGSGSTSGVVALTHAWLSDGAAASYSLPDAEHVEIED